MRLNSVTRLWLEFRALPRSRRLLLLEAAICLAVARLAILLLPFPRIARYLGQLHSPEEDSTGSQAGQAAAREISWAVGRSSSFLPFRVVCLPRALAGWQMLHRRRIAGRLHFGVSRDASAALRTHAWLEAYGVEVTGYPEANDCVEIAYLAR
jgi:hypothetical protein